MNLKQFRAARKKALQPAKINLRNLWAVVQAFFRKPEFFIAGLSLSAHVYEQIIWRRTRVMIKSKKCWDQGACVWCGCDILGKTMEDRGCERNDEWGSCYPPMMSKDVWDHYKELHHIKLFD